MNICNNFFSTAYSYFLKNFFFRVYHTIKYFIRNYNYATYNFTHYRYFYFKIFRRIVFYPNFPYYKTKRMVFR